MKPLTSISITAPGFYGLNLQDADIDLPPGYSLVANNCIIDNYGRLGSRKGWIKANSTSADLSTANITAIQELIGLDGTSYVLCTGNGKIYKLVAGALILLTYDGGGVAPTLTLENWQIVTLNGKAYFFQSGYDTLIFDPIVSTTTWRRVTEAAGYVATIPQANCALSAFGRLWCAGTPSDKHTIAFSDLLSGHIWTTGTAGTLDVSKVWANGSDEIIALAAHNNFLIIFGRRHILIYSGADTPATMVLSDTITSIGCAARDSVQSTGSDLIFLSHTGVRSLMRTIQEKSAPLGDLSKNIRDHLIADTIGSNADAIKSIYSDVNSFYLVTIPTSNQTYCFDTRAPLENGAYRVTSWTLVPKCFAVTKAKNLYMGFAGYIGTYYGYLDDASTYVMSWYSTHLRFGDPNIEMILKKILLVVIGGNGQNIAIKYAHDYKTNYYDSSISLSNASSYEYGIAEYGLAEYSMVSNINNKGANVGGTGKVVQIGLETTINGTQLSFQKIDLFAKIGKMVM